MKMLGMKNAGDEVRDHKFALVLNLNMYLLFLFIDESTRNSCCLKLPPSRPPMLNMGRVGVNII